MVTMHITFIDFIGISGVAVIVIAYTLLQIEKMGAQDLSFSLLNSIGALLIIVSLLYNWNLASFLMEFTWMILSLYGVYKYYRTKR